MTDLLPTEDSAADNPFCITAAALDAFDHLPFVPLDAVGMPLPGADFIAHAAALGNIDSKIKRGESPRDYRLRFGPLLERLYRCALYDPTFYLPVKIKGKIKYARFVPGHCWGDKHPVAGPRGVRQGGVVVIGKCLGAEEERQCRNFVGKSGALLTQVLREIGLHPSQFDEWYIANLVRHVHLDPSRSQLAKGWIKNCEILLHQELRLLLPRFVICFGSEASTWLMGGEVAGGASSGHGRIMKKRIPLHCEGEEPRWHEFSYMTCLHPAAVVRTPDRRPEFKGTLLRFSQLVSGELSPDDVYERPDHRVIWDLQELRQTVDQVLAEHAASGLPMQPIALDCEWHGDYWTSCNRTLKGELAGGKNTVSEDKGEKESWLRTVQFSHRPGFARTIVLRHGGRRSPDGNDRVGMPAFVPSIASAVAEIKRLVTSTPGRHVRVVGHLLKADLPWLVQLDAELGETLIRQFDPPEDDPDPDGVTRLFGWQKSQLFGGFDTLYGIHSYQETAERKLEVACMTSCGVRRYDGDVQKEKKQICDESKVSAKKMGGYGEISDETIHKYGGWDADGTMRLFTILTKPGGLLDSDQYGNNSWPAFWISQGKLTAELEMEMTGLLIDHKRAEKLTGIYAEAYGNLLVKIQNLVGWPNTFEEDGTLKRPGFNPRSTQQTRCVLFGPAMSGKIDKDTGEGLDPRPEDVRDSLVLDLTPIKTTGKPSKGWDKVVAKRQEADFSPSTDKETLGILLARAIAADDQQAAEVLRTLRWYRFINRVTTGVLCPPDDASECYFDEDGDLVYEKGVMAAVQWDRRVRTTFLPVDTGRVSSVNINIQNFSKRREKDLKDILQSKYAYPLRSIVMAPDGWVYVESDFTGAELLAMAIQSGSELMVDHCQRASLPESDPRHYDIHSRGAKFAFKLDCAPLKSALDANKLSHLRDIAKTIMFGLPYGRGDDAVMRAIEETGTKVDPQDVVAVREFIFGSYPELEPFFQKCRDRVENPGWMRNCFGRYRRFQLTDEASLADVQRIAGNFPIQSCVADCTSTAIKLMRHFPGRVDGDGRFKYLMVAQVHDAVMSQVRVEYLSWYLAEVLPTCMTKSITIYACDLDGKRLPNRPGYHLGFDSSLYKWWGHKMTREDGLAMGIEADLLPKAKK